MKFIAAMDHSGGSTGGVLERYGCEYTEENKMDLVHEMRLRMITSPDFNSNNIWAAILYKDSVERGAVDVLGNKGIEAILKIDSGCHMNGLLKDFEVDDMIDYALTKGCTGTKMRSIVKTPNILNAILDQQFELATVIYNAGLMPIVEPEVPIEHEMKNMLEEMLTRELYNRLDKFDGKCILKLTLPDTPNLHHKLTQHPNVSKVVGLSGGYNTSEACSRLGLQDDMTASFSRALSEGLFVTQSEEEFNQRLSKNIKLITEASE
jgi:fructose-bisphosphate aldolase class I|tara:strand:- start:910 stop:1701 length:792 start_codon:yes stop_codon:yes gene_type:complete